MARTIDLSRTVHDLVADNPEVATIMRDLGFADIAKPMALETVGRVMTIPRGAQIKGIDLASVVEALEAAGFEVTGRPGAASATPAPTGEKDAAAGAADATADASAAAAAGAATDATDEAGRARLLSSYVSRLSAGEDLESVRREFVANFSDVDAAEIARAEQGLIEGGAKVEDVQRLCDVHSALFHGATREERVANAEAAVMESIAGGSGKDDFKTRVLAALKGHPVNVLTLENKAIARQVAATQQALDAGDDAAAAREVALLAQVSGHYAKKGDLLYPVLKVRHGYSGPADVMWGVDDEIRDELRALVATRPDERGSWHDRAVAVVRRADEMGGEHPAAAVREVLHTAGVAAVLRRPARLRAVHGRPLRARPLGRGREVRGVPGRARLAGQRRHRASHGHAFRRAAGRRAEHHPHGAHVRGREEHQPILERRRRREALQAVCKRARS